MSVEDYDEDIDYLEDILNGEELEIEEYDKSDDMDPVPEVSKKPVPKVGRPKNLPVEKKAIERKKPRVSSKPALSAIDFNQGPIENLIPIPEALQVRSFGGPEAGWNVAHIRSVNLTHGLYSTLPKSCNPDTCPANKCGQCPVPNREDWRGRNCPVDVVEAFKQFASYISDLQIGPTDHTDLMLVTDLVSLHIRERWIDFELKHQDMKQLQVGGINQKTGKVHYNDITNTHLKALDDCREQRRKIYKELLASRESKRKAEASKGSKTNSALDWLSELAKVAEQSEE